MSIKRSNERGNLKWKDEMRIILLFKKSLLWHKNGSSINLKRAESQQKKEKRKKNLIFVYATKNNNFHLVRSMNRMRKRDVVKQDSCCLFKVDVVHVIVIIFEC
jgi:hypothetical protein